jgi:hypothetical protein
VRVVILAGLLSYLLKYALPLAKLLLLLLRFKCIVHRTASSSFWCHTALAPATVTPSSVTECAPWPTRSTRSNQAVLANALLPSAVTRCAFICHSSLNTQRKTVPRAPIRSPTPRQPLFNNSTEE